MHLRSLGFLDAATTAAGPDGGVDVRGRGVIAQVKHYSAPVGIAEVQRLRGTAVDERVVFYASSGFSHSARRFAEQAGMPLFTIYENGSARPETAAAAALQAEGLQSLSDLFGSLRAIQEPLSRVSPHIELFTHAVLQFSADGELNVKMSELVATFDGVLPETYIREVGFDWMSFIVKDAKGIVEWIARRTAPLFEASSELSAHIESLDGDFSREDVQHIRGVLLSLIAAWESVNHELSTRLPVAPMSIPASAGD